MAKKQFLIIFLIQFTALFSQFNNVTSSYENSNLIRDEHKYILDAFKIIIHCKINFMKYDIYM